MSTESDALKATIADLQADLDSSRQATAEAMRQAGAAEAERKVLADKLAAAEAAQAEWSELMGHIERERAVAADQAAELAAVRESNTWKAGRAVTTPARWITSRREQ